MAGENQESLQQWAGRLRDGSSTVSIDEDPTLHMVERTAKDGKWAFAAEHARRYIASAGLDDGWDGPRPILLLYTRGRRTGLVRRNPLLYWEAAGVPVVIGSRGGDIRHPDWYLNILEDRNVHVRQGGDFYPAIARVLSPDARQEQWGPLTNRYPMFLEYQDRSVRQIPLVGLSRADG